MRILLFEGQGSIRIDACAVGGCRFPIVDEDTPIVSEFQLVCPKPGDTDPQIADWKRLIGFQNLYPSKTWRSQEFDLDDPNLAESGAYGSNGIYSPNLTVGDIFVPPAEIFAEAKDGGLAATNAEAHAQFTNKPWVTQTITREDDPGLIDGLFAAHWRLSLAAVGQHPYIYRGARITITYDLTGLYILDARNTAYIYGNFSSFLDFNTHDPESLIPHGTGLKSDFEPFEYTADSQEEISEDSVTIADLTGGIGNNSLTVVYSDINNYSMLPDVGVGDPGPVTGWNCAIGAHVPDGGRDNEYKTTKKVKVDVRGVTKQIGASVHERLSP